MPTRRRLFATSKPLTAALVHKWQHNNKDFSYVWPVWAGSCLPACFGCVSLSASSESVPDCSSSDRARLQRNWPHIWSLTMVANSICLKQLSSLTTYLRILIVFDRWHYRALTLWIIRRMRMASGRERTSLMLWPFSMRISCLCVCHSSNLDGLCWHSDLNQGLIFERLTAGREAAHTCQRQIMKLLESQNDSSRSESRLQWITITRIPALTDGSRKWCRKNEPL